MVLFIRICPILDADWNKTRPEKKTVHRRISTVYDSAGSIKNGPQNPTNAKPGYSQSARSRMLRAPHRVAGYCGRARFLIALERNDGSIPAPCPQAPPTSRATYPRRRSIRMVSSVSAQATSEKTAPTAPALAMPGPATTAEPTAVPKLMPMLNAVGSTELASIMALG